MRGGRDPETGRSVLFAAFGAEEEGLLGSCSYVHGIPAVPLAKTRAMMNFDMVGRLRDNTVYISGGETSWVWNPLVTNSNEPALSLAISESSCTGCTDHVCFWQAGIPFVGFFTGLHDEYHRPGDDVELIDFSGLSRIGALALRVLEPARGDAGGTSSHREVSLLDPVRRPKDSQRCQRLSPAT